MILLIPLIIVIGLYFGVHELQEHIHADAARQHNEQSLEPSDGASKKATETDSDEGQGANASTSSTENNNE
ncbi:hypothetical protein LMG33818_000470 [Halomonadaceae bacterium LMG 33818]|uniref:hypothetical protein n=1 Tax=Cernens ardua TaxID=3402176 RepID=UPI003EDC3EA3